jgi:acrylyl-CoA reductase (NADPH)
MLEAALGIAVRYGAERQSFGRPLLQHQGLAWSLADVATELEAARLLTASAITAVESGRDAVLPAAHAKKFTARAAERGIAACIQAMGANGLREDYPLGRHLTLARIAHYVDGSTEMQNQRIAAALFGTWGGTAL